MAIGRTDYSEDLVAAARSVLLEVTRLLGEYRDDIVIIGGWVPELLLSGGPMKHVGSTDVDLALNHQALAEPRYKTILDLLQSRGYAQSSEQPFIFKRTIPLPDRAITVQVDLLAGEYEGTGRSRRHQRIQDVKARKVRGCDLAFGMSTEVTIHGILPGGAEDSATIRVASIVPFIVMKGMAMHDRLKEKDAWDIYFCVTNYPEGLDALVKEFQPHMDKGLVREGLEKIASKFASVNQVGPTHVVDFEKVDDRDERARIQRDAFEKVNYLLGKLGIVG
ncbi:MAG: hypothetical protein HY675_07970 [Chloroflexi bacterium]|nr:hypothetical protein [Chloroflexota bacterium]